MHHISKAICSLEEGREDFLAFYPILGLDVRNGWIQERFFQMYFKGA